MPRNESLDIRNGIQALVENAPAGGLFHDAEMEATARNAFCIRLAEGGPIYTVAVTYGGSLSVPSRPISGPDYKLDDEGRTVDAYSGEPLDL